MDAATKSIYSGRLRSSARRFAAQPASAASHQGASRGCQSSCRKLARCARTAIFSAVPGKARVGAVGGSAGP